MNARTTHYENHQTERFTNNFHYYSFPIQNRIMPIKKKRYSRHPSGTEQPGGPTGPPLAWRLLTDCDCALSSFLAHAAQTENPAISIEIWMSSISLILTELSGTQLWENPYLALSCFINLEGRPRRLRSGNHYCARSLL
jgi:hypothetical protein